jgi:chromosome segregation ATPase
MRIRILVASVVGTALMAGASSACLAGEKTDTVDISAILQDEPATPADARASLDAAVGVETRANKELEAAVSARDSAQIALANAQDRLDEIHATLNSLRRSDPARTGLAREAAEIEHKIDKDLFTRLDDARDRVANAKHDLHAAQKVKQAALEQVRIASPSDGRLTYNAEYDFGTPASRASQRRAFE